MSNLSEIRGRPSINRENVEDDTSFLKTHESMSEEFSEELDKTFEDCSQSSGCEESPQMKRKDYLNKPRKTPQRQTNASYSNVVNQQCIKYNRDATRQSNNSISIINIFVICVALAVAVCWFYSTSEPLKQCSFSTLKKVYPQQKDTVWQTLSIGIESILNRRSHAPAVYLFIHQPQVAMQPIIQDIATLSSKCFSKDAKPIVMDSQDFQSAHAVRDYGYAIEKYKTYIREGNVTLILNLNDIPPEAARALHSICDTITPLVEDVVIYMSLQIPARNKKPVQSAHDTLNNLWGSVLDANELEPLITRVTDQVIQLV